MEQKLREAGLLRLGKFRVSLVASDSESGWARDELLEDFSVFGNDLRWGTQPGNHRVLLSKRAPRVPAGLRPAFRFRDASCFGWGRVRRVSYGDRAGVLTDHRAGKTYIWAESRERIRELAYLFILSWVGERLDLNGLHRVHGLGFHSPKHGKSALLMMPSGVGKSTLACALGGSGVEYFSDEIPLHDGRVLYPFPIRLALGAKAAELLKLELSSFRKFRRRGYDEKLLLPLESLGPVSGPKPIDVILVCRRSGRRSSPSIKRVTPLHALAELSVGSVVGVGVPQMTEHLLRFDPGHLAGLAKIAVSRVACASRLALKVPCYRFELSDEPLANRTWLERWMESLESR